MKRVLWLDLLRICSIFFVIIIHVVCLKWYTEIPSSINWQFLNLLDSISRFCVPIFLMISGALILNKKNLDLKLFYKKNIFRLITALLFWSLIYAIFNNWDLLKDISFSNIKTIILSFNGFNYHLHFLLSLIGLYIITPLLRKIIEDEKLLNYLLILSIIFSIIFPTINTIFIFVNYINSNVYIIFQSLTNWLFKINIPFVSGWLVFYLTGYKLFKSDIKHSKLIYFLGILSCVFTILSTSYISIKLNTPISNFYDYNTLNVYIMSVALFLFFKNIISKINFNKIIEKQINNLAENIFGIYLIHDVFIIYFRRKNIFNLTSNYFIDVLLLSIIVFILSYLVIFIIKKIPKISKYIT